jgi:hypothetical protein
MDHAQRPETRVVSFPKCGRTWLRLLIAHVLHVRFGLVHANPLNNSQVPLVCLNPRVPLISFRHDGDPFQKRPEELDEQDIGVSPEWRTIFLARDPRDVVVSAYFEKTRRSHQYPKALAFRGSLAEFVRCEVGSVRTLIRYYQLWSRALSQTPSALLIRYEDLHRDGVRELRRVMASLGVGKVGIGILRDALEWASFENMRRMEELDLFRSQRLRPGRLVDSESFKTRRGRVGGYRDYLDDEDIFFIEDLMHRELAGAFGYACRELTPEDSQARATRRPGTGPDSPRG